MSLPERRVLTMGAVHPPQAAPPANACQCIGERSAPLTDPVLSRLAHLYLCEELSTYHIAELTGLDRQKSPASCGGRAYRYGHAARAGSGQIAAEPTQPTSLRSSLSCTFTSISPSPRSARCWESRPRPFATACAATASRPGPAAAGSARTGGRSQSMRSGIFTAAMGYRRRTSAASSAPPLRRSCAVLTTTGFPSGPAVQYRRLDPPRSSWSMPCTPIPW